MHKGKLKRQLWKENKEKIDTNDTRNVAKPEEPREQFKKKSNKEIVWFKELEKIQKPGERLKHNQ